MTKYNPTQNIRRSLKLSVLALVAGSALWLSGCTQQQRTNFKETWRAQSGIPRKIALYAADGKLIREWTTKTGVDDRGGSVTFLDASGSRVMIGGTYVIEEAK